MLPALFVSHGAPTLILSDAPARDFLAQLASVVERPKEVLCVSAHWETEKPAASTVARPETIHDFYGFPEELYRLRYDAPGAPDLATRATALLSAAGIAAETDAARGLDHGAWVPMLLGWPEADIPVTQLSIQHPLGPAHHLAVGRALRPLREEGVLILASGSATHNLRELHRGAAPIPPSAWASAFADWLAQKIEAGDRAALTDYRRQAPNAARAHPRDEHFLPLFVALGAGQDDRPGRRLHRSWTFGGLAMDAYAFD
jgi:4,5-DOPA dioxygenase extradiol